MGTNDLPLGDISVKVNDNNYHVVRFVRNGANATLQIDDYNVQTLSPQGNNCTLLYFVLFTTRTRKHISTIMLFYVYVHSNQNTLSFHLHRVTTITIVQNCCHRQLTPAHY